MNLVYVLSASGIITAGHAGRDPGNGMPRKDCWENSALKNIFSISRAVGCSFSVCAATSTGNPTPLITVTKCSGFSSSVYPCLYVWVLLQ